MSNDEIITVTKSPHIEDKDSLPWSYEKSKFLGWYDEVFQEGYKNPDYTPQSLIAAISHLRKLGYGVKRRSGNGRRISRLHCGLHKRRD